MKPRSRIGFDHTPELGALRRRYEAGLGPRLRTLRAALETSRRGGNPPLELLRQLRTTAGCFEVEEVAQAAVALEAMLDEGRADWAWALSLIDGLLAAQPTEKHVPVAAAGVGPRIAFVGRDGALREGLTRSAKRAGGTVIPAEVLGAALELALRAEVDGFAIEVSREKAASSFRTARSLRFSMRSRPIVFVGDPTVDRRRPGGAVIETIESLDVVVDTVARERNVPRVLVLDDDSVAAKLTVERLSQAGMTPLHLVDTTSALPAMDEFAPRAVVLEVALRGVGGLDLCRRIRAAERWRHVPIVFVTAIADNDTRLQAFEAGGDDLLLKPLDGRELTTRLRLRIARARSAQDAWELDPATTAWTRTRMLQWLMESKEAGLVLVRLRGLREMNAARGLATGDLLLLSAVRSMMLETRATDIVARWSSTELLVGLPDASSDDAQQVAERLAEALGSVIHSEADGPGPGLEVGWSSTREGAAPEAWLARAFERRDRVTL